MFLVRVSVANRVGIARERGDINKEEDQSFSSDERVVTREEHKAAKQDGANERAHFTAAVEDLGRELDANFTEIICLAVRERRSSGTLGGVAGSLPAPL